MHQAISDGVETFTGRRLLNDGAASGRARVKGRGRDVRPLRHSRVGRSNVISVEREEAHQIGGRAEFVRIELAEQVRRAGGRRRQTLQVARQHSAMRIISGEADDLGRLVADQHLGALHRVEAGAEEYRPRRVEVIGRHVVAIRPHADVRVIGEGTGEGQEVVSEILTGRVARLRHGDVHVHLARPIESQVELEEEPAVGQLIIEHYRVAVVIRRIRDADQQRAQLALRNEHRARLIVDREAAIGNGDYMIRTDRGVGVRRCEATAEEDRAGVHVRAVEILYRVGDGVGLDIPELEIIQRRVGERSRFRDRLRLDSCGVHLVLLPLAILEYGLFDFIGTDGSARDVAQGRRLGEGDCL